MTQRMPCRVPALFALLTALFVGTNGCGYGSNPPPPGSELKPREGLELGLPLRVTLASPVIADATSGESSKTVDDALKHLNATIKNAKLYDSKGSEIHFETAIERKTGATKKVTRGMTIVKLAD
jgi:hypothetical protein